MFASLEKLESRLLLAATFRFSNGALSVTGNAATDDLLFSGGGLQGEVDVAVDQDGDGIRELTRQFSGVQSISVATGQGLSKVACRDLDILGGLQISTGGSRDEVDLQGCKLGDPLRVALGAGNDTFHLSRFSVVQGNLDVNGGHGNDEIRLSGGVRVDGQLKLAGAGGNDEVELRRNVLVLGQANIALGADVNKARLEDQVQFVTDLTITGGALEDEVELSDHVQVGGDALLSLGAGENEVRIENNVTVTDWLNIVTGGDNDDVVIRHDLATGGVGLGRLSIATWAGSDDLDILGAVTVDGLTLVNTGNGNDRLDVGDASVPLTTLLAGGLTCELGGGNDEFTITRTQITAAAWVNGGNGLDAGDDNGQNLFSQPLVALNFDGGNLRR